MTFIYIARFHRSSLSEKLRRVKIEEQHAVNRTIISTHNGVIRSFTQVNKKSEQAELWNNLT